MDAGAPHGREEETMAAKLKLNKEVNPEAPSMNCIQEAMYVSPYFLLATEHLQRW
jgi:hypothetical protein